MTTMNEAWLVKQMREAFKQRYPAGYWRKTHGEMYSRNLPDVLCLSRDFATLVEFKWDRSAGRDPLGAHALSLLTPGQLHELAEVAGAASPLRGRVIVGCAAESNGYSGAMALSFDLVQLALTPLERELLNRHTLKSTLVRLLECVPGHRTLTLPGGTLAQMWDKREQKHVDRLLGGVAVAQQEVLE